MPLRFTVCGGASSRIAAGFGTGSSVGASFTGFTVSTNVSLMLTGVPPIVFVTVTVIVAVPNWSSAGVIVSVRVDPLPATVRLAGALGTSVVLLDVAVNGSNPDPAALSP